jgi:hypothetical protein
LEGDLNKMRGCMQIVWHTNLVIVRQAIDLVNENLKRNVRVDAVGARHGLAQLLKRVGQMRILVLRINDIDNRSTATKDQIRIECRITNINLSREVPDLELNKRAIGDVYATSAAITIITDVTTVRMCACATKAVV